MLGSLACATKPGCIRCPFPEPGVSVRVDLEVAGKAEAGDRLQMGAQRWHVLSLPSARTHPVFQWFGIFPNLFCPFLSAVPRAARPAATFTGNVLAAGLPALPALGPLD